jgi:hypothetical protein
MVIMLAEMKFRISRYSRILNTVDTSYRGLTNSIILDQWIRFPLERNYSGFEDGRFLGCSAV